MNPFTIGTILFFFLVSSCGQEPESPGQDLEETLAQIDEKFEEMEVPWNTIDTDPKFTLEIPANMTPNSELNEQADLAYAHASRVGNITKEHYVIVLSHHKDSMLTPRKEMSLESYAAIAVDNMGTNKDEYEILNEEPVVEKINGLDCIVYEMRASDGIGQEKVSIYYQYGIFSAQDYFYQVLTWTLLAQEEEFKETLSRIVHSFKEKESSL